MMRMTLKIKNISILILVIGTILSLAACAATGSQVASPADYRGQIWELVMTGGLDSKFLLATATIPGESSELVNGTFKSKINLPEYGDGKADIRVKGELNYGTLNSKVEGQADFGSEKVPLWGEIAGQCLGPRCSGTYHIKYAQGGFQGSWKGEVYNKRPQIRSWSFSGSEDKSTEAE